MASETPRQLREESNSIIKHLNECLAAAAELDRIVFKVSCSPTLRLQALVASFSKMHELIHNADVQVSKAGERLINEAALSELHQQTKKGAAQRRISVRRRLAEPSDCPIADSTKRQMQPHIAGRKVLSSGSGHALV